jgi:hypothetical protein
MPRFVISWFGWDLRDMELLSDELMEAWVHRLEQLCEHQYWRIERLGNPIDLIIGSRGRSITPREFFAFQIEWDRLNEQFGFRFSGVLNLVDERHEWAASDPWECYVQGRVTAGDSIGRPSRHRQKD